ncbi:MAG TPA: agmatinase [Sphingomonadales bacterium]|nr:agmatinase [Sphingomonadales bacterium]
MPYLPPEKGFLGLAKGEAVPMAKAKAIVVPFGCEQTVSYGTGTAKGPAAILKASHQVELFDEEFWSEPVYEYGVATLKAFPIQRPMSKAVAQLEGIVAKVLEEGKFPLTLGGEHGLSPGAIRAVLKNYPKLSILHFDAHADLRDGYGKHFYSHAAAVRRMLELGDIRIVSCGIRNISKGEIPYLESNRERIHIFWGKDRLSYDPRKMIDLLGDRPVYLSFDVDGFDSSLMPMTGTPEPGGLFWEDVMAILREAGRRLNIIGADVVELAPSKWNHAPDFLTAKLCYKILSWSLAKKKPA